MTAGAETHAAAAPLDDLTALCPASLTDEVPLFAADARFALAHGGPLTRAFLTAITRSWPANALVVDSMLVWLRPDLCPGDPLWHREVYPREDTGAYARANAERAVQHAACVWGEGPAPELLRGGFGVDALPEPTVDGRWCKASHSRRNAQIEALIAAGTLHPEPTAIGLIHRYDGDTFLRERRASSSGLRFWIRATLNSQRPIANGLRNVSGLLR